jgi:hypothetical protein
MTEKKPQHPCCGFPVSGAAPAGSLSGSARQMGQMSRLVRIRHPVLVEVAPDAQAREGRVLRVDCAVDASSSISS